MAVHRVKDTILGKHSKIKEIILYFSGEKENPYSFCVLRLTPKGLCIIMKLGFLLGTPGIERSKVEHF